MSVRNWKDIVSNTSFAEFYRKVVDGIPTKCPQCVRNFRIKSKRGAQDHLRNYHS